jgi:hypothetical protein
MPPITNACLVGKQAIRFLLFALPVFFQNLSLVTPVSSFSIGYATVQEYEMSCRDILRSAQGYVLSYNGLFSGRKKSVAGNEYYSTRNAKYLGRDGSETSEVRLIDEAGFNRIREENQGTTTILATTLLQKESIRVIIDTGKIQSDLQMVKDSSVDYKREYQMYLFLDRKTGLLSSIMGTPGDNSNSYPECMPSLDSGVNYLHCNEVPASKILIGQAHGHPATNEPGRETSNKMSLADLRTAGRWQIAIYGVDAMYDDIGSPGYIHRANPDGSADTRVGWTRGSYPYTAGDRAFSIGLDALKTWGRSGTPAFR